MLRKQCSLATSVARGHKALLNSVKHCSWSLSVVGAQNAVLVVRKHCSRSHTVADDCEAMPEKLPKVECVCSVHTSLTATGL